MRKSKRSWALLFIFAFALAGHHCAAEDWVITKEGGAYRVNGLRLMANGTLVDGNGARVKALTRADMDQIGAATDAFEAGHASPYAKPAIVGGTTKPAESPTTQVSNVPAAAPESSGQSLHDSEIPIWAGGTAPNSEVRHKEEGPTLLGGILVFGALVVWVLICLTPILVPLAALAILVSFFRSRR